MRKPGLLFMALLIASFSFAQEDSWDVYIAQYEDGAGSTMYNVSVLEEAPNKKLPWVMMVDFEAVGCDDKGFPDKRSFQRIYDAEDMLEASLQKIEYREVGTFTYQCVRTNYIYISDTSDIEIVKEWYEARSDYPAKFFYRFDPDWNAYLDFIYPSPEIIEYMMNQRVIANLMQNGDPLTKERPIDHWAYFPDNAKRTVFESYLKQQGFTIDKKWKDKDYDLPFAIRFSKEDIPDLMDFDNQTQALRKKAKELNGNYDGWESIVLSEDN